MKRYTFVCHEYIGYGSYVISWRRIRCAPELLQRYLKKDPTIHFVLNGWPKVFGSDGKTPWDFDV